MRFFSVLFCVTLASSVAFGGDITSIYDIQHTVDPSGDSPLNGQTVTIEGVVTAANYNGFFVTDAAGPWNSIYVYTDAAGCAVEDGDGVTVTGVVDEYFNMTEITQSGDATPVQVSCSITSSGFEIPPDQKSFQTESIFDLSSPVIMSLRSSSLHTPSCSSVLPGEMHS